MSKGTTFVLIYSVVLLGLFCLFCFLMSGVNPSPLADARRNSSALIIINDESSNNQSSSNSSNSSNSTFARRTFDFENIYYNESLFPISFVSPEFGLEKVDSKSPYSYTLFQVPTANINDDDDKSENNVVYDSEEFNKTHILVKSLKGHRRSVKSSEEYNRIIEKSGDVILKIIDDSGQSRIEIKISSNGSLKNNKLRTNRSLMKITSKANDSEIFNKSELINTIIKIMPNNSVIVDEFEDTKNDNQNITSTKEMESLESKHTTTKTPKRVNNLEMLLITSENALNISLDNITNHKTEIKFEDPLNNEPRSIRNSTKTSTNETANDTTTHEIVNLMSVTVKNMSTNNFSTPIFSSEVYNDNSNIENTTKPISIDVSNVMRVLKKYSQNNSTVLKKNISFDSTSSTATYKETSTNTSEVIKYS